MRIRVISMLGVGVVRKKIYYDLLGRRHCCCYEENGKN